MRFKKGSNKAIMFEQRCRLIDEQITAGLTSATEIFNKLKDAEPFLNQKSSALILFCWRRLHEKNGAPDLKEMFDKRRALTDEQIAAGMTSPTKIADELRGKEPFQKLTYNSLREACRCHLRDKGVRATKINTKNAYQIKSVPPSPVLPGATATAFDELIGKVSLNLPLGAHREVEKLLNVIRPEYQKLIAATGTREADEIQSTKLKRQIADLEARIVELRAHRCPDANADLQNENQELRAKIRELTIRVETLSRSTAPRIIARTGFAG